MYVCVLLAFKIENLTKNASHLISSHQYLHRSKDVMANKKPGYTNPAFKAMGIPTLRLPSRNWMIFWTVMTTSIGGIIYDKHQQKQIRNRYREMVEPLAQQHMDIERKPRKITVFIAPPPSDYLDTSLKVWKRYVKPILYWGGLDYELIEEDSQGMIRNEVANRIRELRKQLIELQVPKPSLEKIDNKKKNKKQDLEELEKFDPQQAQKFKKEFDYSKALGVYREWTTPEVVYEDSLAEDPALSGGVICLGRGSYKEYITGLHEGLLGPLEAPPTPEPETKKPEEGETPKEGETLKEGETPKEPTNEEPSEEERSARRKIPPPFIKPDQYSSVEYPSELQGIVRDPKTNCPILPHQSLLVIPIPNLIGFLSIPERIYRFYNKRYFAEEALSATKDLVLKKGIRSFEDPKDLDISKEEELDWPKSWVQRGMERESEWTRELKSDPRVAQQLHVYNERVKDNEQEKE
ncbi:ZYRO0G20460p [Zygosaccharomyces rouxii]|uniref:Mitochondrial import inner membrane translocase subunit TIM54 n=2 Tax=Zygosaccharomyces rouxii TaxID=4956 RepID=C5E1F0_ZYGRC|nr:uncharacterized protein ZYRO0G20460g [Zygosaccharomyces rouxii]CAR29934.1 ZYRO0G20460p [Zygosaccharomyces rouxii]